MFETFKSTNSCKWTFDDVIPMKSESDDYIHRNKNIAFCLDAIHSVQTQQEKEIRIF